MERNQLYRDAIKRNIEELKTKSFGSPEYLRATAIVEAYRHEEVMAMYEETITLQRETIAVQKESNRIQKWLIWLTVALLALTSVLLYFTYKLVP
jgi:magnesium-transporting ATPase (P-type)